MWNDNADRAGPSRGLGKDRIRLAAGGHCHVIAAAGTNATHADNQRYFAVLNQLPQMMINVVTASYRAARRVNSCDDGDNVRIVAHPVDLLLNEAVLLVVDCAADIDNGDLLAGVFFQ